MLAPSGRSIGRSTRPMAGSNDSHFFRVQRVKYAKVWPIPEVSWTAPAPLLSWFTVSWLPTAQEHLCAQLTGSRSCPVTPLVSAHLPRDILVFTVALGRILCRLHPTPFATEAVGCSAGSRSTLGFSLGLCCCPRVACTTVGTLLSRGRPIRQVRAPNVSSGLLPRRSSVLPRLNGIIARLIWALVHTQNTHTDDVDG